MRIQELGLPEALVERFRELGYDELWPPQAQAAPHAVNGDNLVLAVPTASGKSLVAYIALLHHALQGGKALYLVPLRALAREKYDELKQFEELGIRVALATGDLDSADPHLRDVDVIVATSEKADALMRHRAHWLGKMNVVVADEVHLIHDGGRGPTLEVTLSRFRQLNPNAQVIALSATVRNSQEVARWLDAEHVKSDWRPVTLREGVLFGRAIHYTDNAKEKVESDHVTSDPVHGLVDDTLHGNGQALVFVNTRKSTEAVAKRLRHIVNPHLQPQERATLTDAANRLRSGPDATDMERTLAACISHGTAFHHAGLTHDERHLVEEAFKDGDLKAIAATPTLAAGINLPARRVIVRDLWRYEAGEGNVPLPVMEYKQMAGRAGRPKYDDVGEALTIAKSQDKKDSILLDYLLAEPETIHSKLGAEPALRRHVLASIASGYVEDEAGLRDFIKSTFFAEQEDIWRIEERITRVIDFLLEEGFITVTEDRFDPTPIGKRVSELYIDPLSAVKLRKAVERAARITQGQDVEVQLQLQETDEGAEQRVQPEVTDFSFLHAVASTPDMRLLYTRRGDTWLEADAVEREHELLLPLPDAPGYDVFLAEVKTALLLQDWIDETDQHRLVEKYNTYPGDIHHRTDTADWLLYALSEIARLLDANLANTLGPLRTRVRHGAKRELLPLLQFRGVGRQRARALHDAGFKKEKDLRGVPITRLADVPGIGPKIAARIKRQLGEDVDETTLDVGDDAPVAGQQTLAHFHDGGDD